MSKLIRLRRQSDAPTRMQECTTVARSSAYRVRIEAKLPAELMDMVISHYCYDKDFLLNCSLISSHWTPHAQRYLFHRVRIAVPRTGFPASPPSLDAFASFFTTHHHISLFITTLRLDSDRWCVRELAICLEGDCSFVSLMRSLRCMKHLILDGLSIEPPPHLPRERTPHVYRFWLPTLTLRRVEAKHGAAERLFQVLQAKDTLNLHYCEIMSLASSAPRKFWTQVLRVKSDLDVFPDFGAEASFPKLRALEFEITGMASEDIVFNVSRDDEISVEVHSNTLAEDNADEECSMSSSRYHTRMNAFLRNHGARLEHLSLDLCSLEPERDIGVTDESWLIYHLDSCCLSLSSLHLGFRVDVHSMSSLQPSSLPEFLDTFTMIQRILSSAPKSLSSVVLALEFGLRTNAFEVSEHFTGDVSAWAYDSVWAELAKTLVDFPQLWHVRLVNNLSRESTLLIVNAPYDNQDRLASGIQASLEARFSQLGRTVVVSFE
ncbi:hypothetical protein EIP91_001955 [Steccherinum ochraceum]|uniref:F-box domain-containing protein n=1 Tax=Steccherinum ochraceum TaxID=92696 RepID=A0A4R0RGR7_9APHY|nr:hypothetical protein EIP91_001955 [Steccherinum ochraceum]